jgi:hypothetical protein
VIPLDLQSVIIDELQSLFDGILFPKMPPKGSAEVLDPVPLNIFSQALPKDKTGNASVYMPYITVQIQGGKQEEEMEPGEARIVLNIGIWDDDPANQGHAHVLNIIETIYQDLFQKRTLGGKYFITTPWEYAVNDDDQWPFFIGAIDSRWNLPIILPTDPNL